MILKPRKNIEDTRLQDENEQENRSASLKWKYLTLIFGFCFTIAVIAIAILLSLIPLRCSHQTPYTPAATKSEVTTVPSFTTEKIGLPLGEMRFVWRDEWGAQPPTAPLDPLMHPVPYVIISHTATDFCRNQLECTFRVRFAQTFHIESRGWSDIGYNFLVGGDGYVYVGRSWDFVGAHTYGYNNRSIGISFIGTFNSYISPQRQLDAAQKLIELGVADGMIASDYKLLAHRQLASTTSPGDALYSVLQKWPHWSADP